MPRVARTYLDNGVFHILSRGNNKQWVFKDDSDFVIYKEILLEIKVEQPFKLYHYCLMSNHVHLLLETNEKTNLSRLMKRLNLMYYHRYKKKYGYSGHFWQDRFKSLLVDSDEYLLGCGLYIERNPVRAKIVNKPEYYQYSSYRYYADGKSDKLIDRDIHYEMMGKNDDERQNRYRELNTDKQLGINGQIFSQLYLGNSEFISRMEKEFKLPNIRLERGRPKKK